MRGRKSTSKGGRRARQDCCDRYVLEDRQSSGMGYADSICIIRIVKLESGLGVTTGGEIAADSASQKQC